MHELNQNQMWDETHQNNVPGSINGIPKWDATEVDPNWDLSLGDQIIRGHEELQDRPLYRDIGSNPTSKWAFWGMSSSRATTRVQGWGKEEAIRRPSREEAGGQLVARIERVAEVPMLMLALSFLAAFVVGYLPEVSPQLREDARFVQDVIIAIFGADFIVRVALAERRFEYLRSRWLDILIIVVPFFRPLRLVMFLPMLMRVIGGLQRVMGPFRAAYVRVVGLITVFSSAGLMLVFEENHEGPIQTFGDALWRAAPWPQVLWWWAFPSSACLRLG